MWLLRDSKTFSANDLWHGAVEAFSKSLSHQHICYHPTSLRSGVILPGHSTLSSCNLVSGALLTAHVRQAQLLSSALAFALLRSDGTVATWGTLVLCCCCLVQFHGDCFMVSFRCFPNDFKSPFGGKNPTPRWYWWFLPCWSPGKPQNISNVCTVTPLRKKLTNLKQYGKHPLHPRVGTYRFLSSFKIWFVFFGIQLYTVVVLGWLTNHGHGWLNVAKDTCVLNNNMRTYFRYRKKKLHFLRPLPMASCLGNITFKKTQKRFIQKDKQNFVYYLPETNYYF